jgi:hypothetical protein
MRDWQTHSRIQTLGIEELDNSQTYPDHIQKNTKIMRNFTQPLEEWEIDKPILRKQTVPIEDVVAT